MEKNNIDKNEFVGQLYDFSQICFSDWITPTDFKEMEKEVISDCFKDDIYLPYMRKYSIYKALLKHCSNIDLSKLDNDEIFTICNYSNLETIIKNMEHDDNDNNIKFIITQLEDIIDYHKDKLIHHSKLENFIEYMIDWMSQANIEELIGKLETKKNGDI